MKQFYLKFIINFFFQFSNKRNDSNLNQEIQQNDYLFLLSRAEILNLKLNGLNCFGFMNNTNK